jgi:hypothetical protein
MDADLIAVVIIVVLSLNLNMCYGFNWKYFVLFLDVGFQILQPTLKDLFIVNYITYFRFCENLKVADGNYLSSNFCAGTHNIL